MHVAGLSLDLYWFVQFVFTALLVAFGFFHLVKSTASRYLVVDANFDQGGGGVDLEDDRRADSEEMLAAAGDGDSCAFCGNSAKKICSGCKAVRYCSQACQMQHWKSNHKAVCKEFKLSGNVNLTPSVKNAYGRTGYRCESSIAASSDPGHGNSMFQQSKVLFPYDEFVKLFNWDKPGFPPCGLLNCGNSCFANVVLQCLACTRPLVAYLLEKGHRRECRRNDWCFFCELQVHVERARQSLQPFSPINILSRLPNIGGNLGCGKQEDAHEFMRFAIDTMQSICLDEFGGEKFLHPSSQETSLIQHIFGGYLQSQVICTKCNKISNRYENMMDLTVEIQGDATSLQDCLNQFTDRERLDGENMYKCDGCNDYVKAWKRLTIHQAPNILTIALKRFQSGRFGKLNKKVSFPENLDLGPYMSEAGDGTDLYRLYAVVVHLDMLNASFFGHYICYTKDFSGNWYRIDDCKVMTVELEEVLAQGAYMLLYSRKHVRPPSVKLLESSRKEGQLVGEAQELQPCSQQPVESFIVAGCLPDDVSLSKESVPEISRVSEDPKSTIECPLDVDLCNPVSSPAGSGNPVCISGGLKESVPEREISSRVNGDPKSATEVLHDMDLCNPESFSSDSKDLVCCSTKCSQAVEVASPVELVHKGFPDLASSSETFSTEARSLECEFSSRITEVESSFQDGNGASSNYGKGLSLESSKGSVSSQENVHEMAVVSLEVPGAALSSVAETLDETNRASSEILSNSSLEPVITVKSGKISPAPCTTETRSSKLAVDNSHCRGNLKPLFSPGFLNKGTRNRSLNGHGKSPREPCEVGSSSEVDSNCNGFSKCDFLHCKSGEINDDSGSLVTSTSVEEWQPEKCLNEDEKVNKAGELGNSCNDKCIGDTVSVLSDKNGSNDCNHDTGQSFLCANGKDQLVGYSVPIQSPIDNSCSRGKKLLFSPGFLDNKRKRSLHRDGKAQMESGDVGPSGTVDINCNGIADPGLTVQHSGEVNDHCGVRDSYRILTSNPIEKQSKNCLNKDEMTNKELGEVGNTSSINCTGVNVSVLCDESCENIYNCDAGHKTIFENDRCQLTDYGMPLRSTYNDKLLGKKSSVRNGEGQELGETVHHPKVEMNCKRLADGRPPPMKQLLDKTKICPKEIWSVCQTSEPNADCNQQFNTGLACEGGQNCKRQRHI